MGRLPETVVAELEGDRLLRREVTDGEDPGLGDRARDPLLLVGSEVSTSETTNLNTCVAISASLSFWMIPAGWTRDRVMSPGKRDQARSVIHAVTFVPGP